MLAVEGIFTEIFNTEEYQNYLLLCFFHHGQYVRSLPMLDHHTQSAAACVYGHSWKQAVLPSFLLIQYPNFPCNDTHLYAFPTSDFVGRKTPKWYTLDSAQKEMQSWTVFLASQFKRITCLGFALTLSKHHCWISVGIYTSSAKGKMAGVLPACLVPYKAQSQEPSMVWCGLFSSLRTTLGSHWHTWQISVFWQPYFKELLRYSNK